MNKSGTLYESRAWEQFISSSKTTGTKRTSLPWFRNGVDLPNYKQLIIDNKDATTAFTASRSTIKSHVSGLVSGTYRFNKTPVLNSYFGNYESSAPDVNLVSIFSQQRAQAQARSAAFKKIRSLQTPFQLGAFGGELRETVDLLKHPLDNFVKLTWDFTKARRRFRDGFNFTSDYKKARLSKPSKHVGNIVKTMSDIWLEYRFGVLPLLSDVKSIGDLILNTALIEARTKGRFYGTDEYLVNNIVDPNFPIGTNLVGRFESTVVAKSECFIHFGLMLQQLDRFEQVHERLLHQVDGLDEVAITAWELLPFSFLVDYFINVQDIINASVTPQSVLSYSAESNVRTVTYSGAVTAPRSATVGQDTIDDIVVKALPHFVIQTRHVARTGGTLAIPPVTLTLPGSNVRYMNIAALIASLNIRRS